jgi:hypothetical protein
MPRMTRMKARFIGLGIGAVIVAIGGIAALAHHGANAGAGTEAASVQSGQSQPPAADFMLRFYSGDQPSRTTLPFTTGSDWILEYHLDCQSIGNQGQLTVTTEHAGSDTTDSAGPSLDITSFQTWGTRTVTGDPGTHVLSVGSECYWRIGIYK